LTKTNLTKNRWWAQRPRSVDSFGSTGGTLVEVHVFFMLFIMEYLVGVHVLFMLFIMEYLVGVHVLLMLCILEYLVVVHVLFMLFVVIYVYWCPTRCPDQMMFLSFNSKTTGATSGTKTVYTSGSLSSPSVFSEVRFAQSLVFCVVFYISLFVIFHLVIVLSVLLWLTGSDYSFGI
jgi:hypothetical protein